MKTCCPETEPTKKTPLEQLEEAIGIKLTESPESPESSKLSREEVEDDMNDIFEVACYMIPRVHPHSDVFQFYLEIIKAYNEAYN